MKMIIYIIIIMMLEMLMIMMRLMMMLLADILTENGFLCCKLLLVRCYVISSIQFVTRIASIT